MLPEVNEGLWVQNTTFILGGGDWVDKGRG